MVQGSEQCRMLPCRVTPKAPRDRHAALIGREAASDICGTSESILGSVAPSSLSMHGARVLRRLRLLVVKIGLQDADLGKVVSGLGQGRGCSHTGEGA